MAGLRNALNSLPKTLDETYNRILLGIDAEYRSEAYTALQWLAFSFRPLKIEEVAEAVVVRPGRFSLQAEDRLRDSRDLLLICSSLVVLSEGELRLAHYSVKEFLVSERIRMGSASAFAMIANSADRKIAEICLTYLLLFGQSYRLTNTSFEDFPLLRYSAWNWYMHAHQVPADLAQTDMNSLAMKLLSPETHPAFTNWLSISAPDQTHYEPLFQENLEFKGSKLYYASYCGLLNVVYKLVGLGEDVNEQGGVYGNALSAAAHTGMLAVVKFLVEAGAEIEGRGAIFQHSSQQRLHDIQRRNEFPLKSQVAGDSRVPHTTDEQGSSLQKLGTDTMAMRQNYGYMIQLAASMGNQSTVRQLLDDEAAAQIHTAEIQNALQEAAFAGHQDVVNLLLTRGADVNARGGPFGSAMQAALSQKDYDIVEILVRNGYVGEEGATALHQAAWGGHVEVVEFLINKGADIEAQDPWGTTVLHWAAWRGHVEVMKLLLDSGANPDTQDSAGGSPLHFAAHSGQESMVQVLLNYGANVNAKAVFRYVRIKCRDVEQRCTPGRTPLHEAAWAGRNGVITLLINRGADSSAQDANGWTALQRAAIRSAGDTVRLLVSLGSR